MAKLVVNPSSSQKREILLPRTVLSIGRDPSNDLVLPDAMVSRRHAVVEWRGGQFFIRDCNSSNGSLVNGDRVSERGLRDGDLVAIGTARLLFRDDVVEEPGSKVVQHPSAPRLVCPTCSADYRKGDLFCKQCGAGLAPPPPQKAVCASCGTAVVLPARFCNACGRPLPAEAPPASPPAPAAAASGGAAVAPVPEPPLAPPLADPAPRDEPEPEVVEAHELKAPAPEAAEPEPEVAESEAPKPAPPDPSLVTVPPPASLPPRLPEPSRTTEPPRTPPPPPPRPAPPAPPRPARVLPAKPPVPDVRRPSPPAPLLARSIAGALDLLVVGVAQAVVLGPVTRYWWSRELPADPAQVPFLPILLSLAAIPVALLLGAGYYVWGWGIAGATPGKKLMGLVVETRDGSIPIGPASALVRVIGYVVSALPLGLGFLLIPFAGEGLHDKLAGTRVARRRE
ncbi:MAG TPA: FHA domain-containing protein [Vicinamibacteria bacterium]|nr:FHA domain-containing protein [Vicinamibacteria bacterium]